MLKTFTNQYSLSKTLRFELKPVGETADYLKDFKSQHLKDVVDTDKQRADDYLILKELIDDYHRAYIEEKLAAPVDPKTGELFLNSEDFKDAYDCYNQLKNKKDAEKLENRKSWEKTQTELRKKLVKAFVGKSDLFKKKLVTRDLPEQLKKSGRWEDYKSAVENFCKFYTYFSGFNENRKNMYTDKDQRTAIAFRLMNENLPRFFNNCDKYKKLMGKYPNLPFGDNKATLEKLGVSSLDEVFQPEFFINLLTQSGIDNHQLLLDGKAEETDEKQIGLNEQINLFRQQKQKEAKEKAKRDNEKSKKVTDLTGFTGLYKQILSEKESSSFVLDEFEDDKELLQKLEEFIKLTTEPEGTLSKLKTALTQLNEVDPQKVFIKTAGLTDVSQKLFHSYPIITTALYTFAENNLKTKKEQKNYTEQKAFSLAELDKRLVGYIQGLESTDPLHEQLKALRDPNQPIKGYLLEAISMAQEETEERPSLEEAIKQVEPLLALEELSKNRQAPKNEGDKGGDGFQQIQEIHKMLDAFMAVSHAVKPLHLVDGRKPIDMPDMDPGFYGEFSKAYEEYSQPCITIYNKSRNHLTKKPFKTDKIKINFDNCNLLNGFVESKTKRSYNGTQYGGYLFRKKREDKGYNYYLGISKSKKLFSFYEEHDGEKSEYERLNYYQPKETSIYGSSYVGSYADDKKKLVDAIILASNNESDLENVVKEFLDLGDDEQTPTRLFSMIENISSELLSIVRKKPGVYEAESQLVSNLKETLRTYNGKAPKLYNLAAKDFESIKILQDAIKNAVKNKSFVYKQISNKEMQSVITTNEMHLFWIYNKDFSENHIKVRKRTDNLHTTYFKALMGADSSCFDLGKGEIFFRKHSIEKRNTHPKGKPIKNKTGLSTNKTTTLEYNIYKDKRYAVDKFLFHLSVEINYKYEKPSKSYLQLFNKKINQALTTDKNIHIIGIDRGERHLLYYTVINQKGEIIEQDTLNKIKAHKNYEVDYQQKLHDKETERQNARKSWSSVENIKELKAGYLSHVVHKLAVLIKEHNAIVCLEDLNFGFKRGRFKVEKQVYQKFEKALIDKLNYLVFKDANVGDAGHYLKAYQLTAPFESFEKMGKQSGILYYVQAAYTSKIDPATGFINFLYTRYQSLSKSKEFFEAFDFIRYNQDQDYFEFSFDYKNFPVRQNLKYYQTQWLACTHGNERYANIRNKQNQWKSEIVNVTSELKTLFNEVSISYKDGEDIKNTIAGQKDTKFYKNLYWLLGLALSLRYSKTGTEIDFILSPIQGKDGKFFDSRKAGTKYPKDADANGAYNIALKGLWNLQQINQHDWDAEKPKKLNLAMENEDWFRFITDWHK